MKSFSLKHLLLFENTNMNVMQHMSQSQKYMKTEKLDQKFQIWNQNVSVILQQLNGSLINQQGQVIKGDNTTQWTNYNTQRISVSKENCAIHWIVIYLAWLFERWAGKRIRSNQSVSPEKSPLHGNGKMFPLTVTVSLISSDGPEILHPHSHSREKVLCLKT